MIKLLHASVIHASPAAAVPTFRNASRTLLQILLFVTVLFGTSSCLQDDNPNLINPPVLEGTIKMRMLNLAEPGQSRALQLESGLKSAAVAYGDYTEFLEIESDSLFADFVDNGGTTRFRTNNRLRFLRRSFQTIIAVPARSSSEYSDTSLFINVIDDSLSRPENVAYVRLVNVAVESNLYVSMRRGCPNGALLANRIAPYVFSGQSELAPGSYIITLTAFDKDGTSAGVQRSYEITVQGDRDYAIIVQDINETGFVLNILDERLETPAGLLPVVQSEATESRVRVVNLSAETVDVEKSTGESPEVISANLDAMTRSPFTIVTACESASDDRFSVIRTADTVNLDVSLDVLVDYTVMIAPDDNDPGTTDAVILPPYTAFTDVGFDLFCNVRVVNLIPQALPVQVLLGARTTDDDVYESGYTLARKALYTTALDPVVVRPGPAPILLFTEQAPRRLLETTLTRFEANKRYLVIAALDADGKPRIFVLDEDEDSGGNTAMEAMPSAVFTQFVNVVSDAEKSLVSFGDVISDAERYHGEFGATALMPGTHTFSIDDAGQEIELIAGQRTLVIASGTIAATDISAFTSEPFEATLGQIRRRYVNASNLVPQAVFALDSLGGEQVTQDLDYRSASDIETVTIERRTSFVVWEAGENRTEDDIIINSDVSQNFGKNYSIILSHSIPEGETADRSNARFRILVQQEY